MNLLGTLLYIWLVWLILFPNSLGKECRKIYDKFMVGWNGTH